MDGERLIFIPINGGDCNLWCKKNKWSLFGKFFLGMVAAIFLIGLFLHWFADTGMSGVDNSISRIPAAQDLDQEFRSIATGMDVDVTSFKLLVVDVCPGCYAETNMNKKEVYLLKSRLGDSFLVRQDLVHEITHIKTGGLDIVLKLLGLLAGVIGGAYLLVQMVWERSMRRFFSLWFWVGAGYLLACFLPEFLPDLVSANWSSFVQIAGGIFLSLVVIVCVCLGWVDRYVGDPMQRFSNKITAKIEGS